MNNDHTVTSTLSIRNRFMRLNEIDSNLGSVQSVLVNYDTIQRLYESKEGDKYPGIWIVFTNGCTIKVAEDIQTIVEFDGRDLEFE